MPSREEDLIEAAYDEAVKTHFAAFYQNVTSGQKIESAGELFDKGFEVLSAIRSRALRGVRRTS